MRRWRGRIHTLLMDDRYTATLEWMYAQTPVFERAGAAAYKPGPERVTELSRAFGNPHRRLRCIHVAGTNGKGSTASTLAAILSAAGLRTGLFTSPHLADFRERIRVDGRMIPRGRVVDFIDRFRRLCPAAEPSFFELTTVMAFEHFAREQVDWAVIEVGLGGRLDSTNIISPELCVITNISLDHTSLLGDTPEAIAAEKAGIIKAGVPVVIGRAEGGVREVFECVAAGMDAPIDFAQDAPLLTAECLPDRNIYHTAAYGTIRGELSGECQVENANTVLHALGHLPALPPDAVRRGFAEVGALTGLRGRWTVMSTSPAVIYDTGHNPGGWAYNAPRLAALAAEAPLEVVLGFAADKDVDTILAMLPRGGVTYRLATPSTPRGLDSADLLGRARAAGLRGEAYPTVAAACAAARSTGHTIFVGGSNFVVADFLSLFSD